ncbi:hypothetical protein ACFE04_027598 [Oxalis oulophora]
MSTRIIQTREGNIVKTLNCNAAVASRDALAKTYKCFMHWRAFESERTTIIDYVIAGINDVLKVENENILSYWLSNTSAILGLLQKNLRSNGFVSASRMKSKMEVCSDNSVWDPEVLPSPRIFTSHLHYKLIKKIRGSEHDIHLEHVFDMFSTGSYLDNLQL